MSLKRKETKKKLVHVPTDLYWVSQLAATRATSAPGSGCPAASLAPLSERNLDIP